MRGAMDVIRVLRSRTPVLLWGPPGVGKSATVAALARKLGLPIEVVIASIREPTDFSGLPVIAADGGVRFAPPAWAQRLAEAGQGILFLDEISTAPPAVQAALLRVVLDRAVGDLVLPSEVAIVAAANPPELAAGGWDLSPPLANRFVHLQFKVDAAGWATEFPGYWGSPPQLPGVDETVWARARALVAGFIRARPHLLLQVPREEAAAGKAWPSPRSWDHASRGLAVVLADGEEPVEAAELIAGAVGEGPGLEFVSWVRDLDLPDPEELLANPGSFKLPQRSDQVYAVLAAVAAAVASKPSAERWTAAWRIIATAVEHGAADVAAAAARTLAHVRQAGWPVPAALITSLGPVMRAAGVI